MDASFQVITGANLISCFAIVLLPKNVDWMETVNWLKTHARCWFPYSRLPEFPTHQETNLMPSQNHFSHLHLLLVAFEVESQILYTIYSPSHLPQLPFDLTSYNLHLLTKSGLQVKWPSHSMYYFICVLFYLY